MCNRDLQQPIYPADEHETCYLHAHHHPDISVDETPAPDYQRRPHKMPATSESKGEVALALITLYLIAALVITGVWCTVQLIITGNTISNMGQQHESR